MPAYPNLLNQATRNPESVKTWVLAELGDLVLPDDSPAVGILGPSRTSANALAAEIYSLPVATAETPGLLSRMISRSYGLQTLWNQFVGLPLQEQQALLAREMALRIESIIPRKPEFVRFYEIVNALAQAADSQAEWAAQQTIRRQLYESAKATGADIQEIWDKIKKGVDPPTPFNAGLFVGLAVGAYVLARLS